MTKLVYIVRCPDSVERGRFCDLVTTELVPRVLELDPRGLKVSLTEPGLPRPFFLPIGARGLALLSVWVDGEPDLRALGAGLFSLGFEVNGYRVEESTYRAYDRDWPDGERTPGAALLTLFRKKPGLTKAEFVRTWHEGHSPMAVRIHPLWNYLRNVVEEPVTPAAPPWGGIVEEHFRDDADLEDPRRFFGSTALMAPRLAHILAQTSTFLHLPTLENYILAERHLRTPIREDAGYGRRPPV